MRIVGAGRPRTDECVISRSAIFASLPRRTKRRRNPPAAAVVARRRRQRSQAAQIRLVEHDQTAQAQMPDELAEGRGEIRLKEQRVPAGDGVEGTLECQLRRVAVGERTRCAGLADSALFVAAWTAAAALSVPTISAGFADKLGGQEGHVAGSTADIGRAHALADPGLAEEPSRGRAAEALLRRESLQLLLGMAERVAGASGFSARRHEQATCGRASASRTASRTWPRITSRGRPRSAAPRPSSRPMRHPP